MSEFVMQGIVTELRCDVLNTTRMGDVEESGLPGSRDVTFTARGRSQTFPIPNGMPTPPLGAKVRIIFEVES